MSHYPYPVPVAVKTKLRCKYSLPGIHYNCRAMGRFILGEKGYCAPHYDATWKAQNPVYGQQHEWHFRVNRFTGEKARCETCTKCGSIRLREGLAQSPCKGHFDQISVREA